MTPDQFKAAREALGLSQQSLAQLFMVGSARTVRRWELGERAIPGPVVVLFNLLLEVQAARDWLHGK